MEAGRRQLPVDAQETQTCTLVKEGETSHHVQQRHSHSTVLCSKGVVYTWTAKTGSGLAMPWPENIAKHTANLEKKKKIKGVDQYDKFYTRALDSWFFSYLLWLLCVVGNKK